MKKIAMFILASMTMTMGYASDTLDGSKWKTVDDNNGQTRFLIEIKKAKNNSYEGVITEVYDQRNKQVCTTCKGSLAGKHLQGVTVIHDLKLKSDGTYDGGKILDPDSGRTYSLQGELKDGGKKLQLRGYLGISALGRSQTWLRAN